MIENDPIPGDEGGHGIDPVHQPGILGKEVLDTIDDGGQEEPGHHPHFHDDLGVAIENVQGREDQGQAQGKNRLNEDDQRQVQRPRGEVDPEDEQHGEEDDQGQEKVDQVGEHYRERQYLPRKVHLLDQVSIADDAVNGAHDGGIEIVPGQEGAEDENRIFVNGVVGHHDSEEDSVDAHHQQGVAQRPGKAEDRVAITQLYVPDHQVSHQLPIFD